MEERLNELEIKLSYAEDLIDELNRTIFRQQQQIDFLVQEVLGLRQQVQTIAAPRSATLREEIPPHY